MPTSSTSGLLPHVSYLLSSSTPGSSYNCNYKGYYNWNSREIETLSATINQTANKRSVRKRITIVTNSVESGSSRSEPEEERTSLGRGAGWAAATVDCLLSGLGCLSQRVLHCGHWAVTWTWRWRWCPCWPLDEMDTNGMWMGRFAIYLISGVGCKLPKLEFQETELRRGIGAGEGSRERAECFG